jgi:hypothetical protein
MTRQDLSHFLETSPTARLLRSEFGPWVIAFLSEAFKAEGNLSLGQSDLRTRLADFLRDLHQERPDVMKGHPERYLSHWTEALWLKRFVDAHSSEPQFQLSPAAEEAIRFVEESIERRKNMVGTEGRLRMILDTLQDIVRGASADPETRLAFLRLQREKIDREIDAITSGKDVQAYHPPQIRERFQTAVHLLRELQSDFRSVEERFLDIAKKVQHLHSAGIENRSRILGFALDAEETLKSQDEGVSFFAFVRFLLSPNEQRTLRKHIDDIQQLEALIHQPESLARMRRMVPSLLAEADKVMRTTHRLSSTMRKLLDSRAAAHRVRLTQIIQEIRHAAIQLRECPPQTVGFTVDVQLDLQSPIARPFWKPELRFAPIALENHQVDARNKDRVVNLIAKLHRLDFRKLRSHIREATFEGAERSLQQMVQDFPLELGVVEILGYLQIAHEDGHSIDHSEKETLIWNADVSNLSASSGKNGVETNSPGTLRITLPRVVFHAKAISRPDGRKPR